MRTRGATTGAVTGRFRSWRPGDIIEAPDGEFGHLPDRMYTARVVSTDPPRPDPSAGASARYEVEQGERWTKIIDTETGEKVGAAIRGADTDALAEAHDRIATLPD